ncbi:MAG: FkbM family methyltransferase [Verrucomicrobiae bacterium]|nr:FkbM family methyltransferase [Verrucomicrobiae bacterium]
MFERFKKSLAWRLLPCADLRFNLPSGISFPIRTRQEARLFQEVMLAGIYARLLDLLPPPRTLADIGCNAAFFTLLVEDRRRQRAPEQAPARGLLLDANPDCVTRASRYLEMNRMAGFNEMVCGLIGRKGQTMDFHVSSADGHSSIFHQYCHRETLRLPSLDLERLLAAHFPNGIDLLKVDIEGAEKFLVEDWPGAVRRCRAVILEWHGFAWSWDEASLAFKDLGFEEKLVVRENENQSTALFVRSGETSGQ